MAETLGSLIDKLSIKSIREFYIKIMMDSKNGDLSQAQLKEKLEILKKQKENLLVEIEKFVAVAGQGDVVLRDQKLKLYNKPHLVGRIGKISTLARGIEALTKKNFELWQLEDEARREGASLSDIGKVKRKIDAANQQRNDLMDKVDELLEEKLKETVKRTRKSYS
jgi:hypothetical protein